MHQSTNSAVVAIEEDRAPKARVKRSTPEVNITCSVPIPAELYLMIQEMCEAGNVEGGVAGYIAGHFVDLAKEGPNDFCLGIVRDIIDHYDLNDDASQRVCEASDNWKLDRKTLVARKRGAGNLPAANLPIAKRKLPPLSLDLPESMRPFLETLAKARQVGTTAKAMLAETVVDPKAILGMVLTTIIRGEDTTIPAIQRVAGAVYLGSLRLSDDKFDKSFVEFYEIDKANPADWIKPHEQGGANP